MGVVMEPVDEARHVLVDQGVAAELTLPIVELVLVRELALEDQVRHLQVAAALGQILDRVAAMPEGSAPTVEIGDRAPAGRGVAERGIERDQLGVVGPLDLPEVGGGDGVRGDGQRVGTTGAVVGDRERLDRHDPAPWLNHRAGARPRSGQDAPERGLVQTTAPPSPK
jgi:hypothetical protein